MKVKYVLCIVTQAIWICGTFQLIFDAVKDFASQSTEALGGEMLSPELRGAPDAS